MGCSEVGCYELQSPSHTGNCCLEGRLGCVRRCFGCLGVRDGRCVPRDPSPILRRVAQRGGQSERTTDPGSRLHLSSPHLAGLRTAQETSQLWRSSRSTCRYALTTLGPPVSPLSSTSPAASARRGTKGRAPPVQPSSTARHMYPRPWRALPIF